VTPNAIRVTEGVPFRVEPIIGGGIRAAMTRLNGTLRPRVPLFAEDGGHMTVSNVIGTIDIGQGVQLVVEPKTEPSDDWIAAVLDLLVGTSRIDVSAERLAGERRQPSTLLDALASIYAARLSHALRRDGPLVLLERRQLDSRSLRGRLRVGDWARSVAIRPHVFPIERDQLESDNDFGRAMALVAVMFARVCSSAEVRGLLLRSARDLRPGTAALRPVSPAVTLRQLPSQWHAYEPAWSVARAVLRRSSLLGSRGSHRGFEVAIEAWPLLEELLERCLVAAARLGQSNGRLLEAEPKIHYPILLPRGTGWRSRSVEPDGLLSEGGAVLASFEAKYSARFAAPGGPPREHVYQALATAAAVGASTSVLVYPGDFEPVSWQVQGFSGRPSSLVALGLGLFSYRRGLGEIGRAELLLRSIDSP